MSVIDYSISAPSKGLDEFSRAERSPSGETQRDDAAILKARAIRSAIGSVSVPPVISPTHFESAYDSYSATRELPGPWGKIIRLLEAGFDAEEIEADGGTVPAEGTVRIAIKLARDLARDWPLSPPTRLGVDPNGAIILERLDGDSKSELIIHSAAKIQLVHYKGAQLLQSSWLS